MLSEWLGKEKLLGFGSKQAASYPSGTMWPHGEWSLGWGRRRPDGGEWHEDPCVGLGVDDVGMAERSEGGKSPLDLSNAPNSTNRPPRGRKGISGYGQQMIKAAGFLMGDRWPRHRKTLGTVTLPPMSEQARREVVAAWPELTRELLRWLTRRLERQGVPPVVCSVTEVQPKRLQAHQEGCLHWHVLWLNLPGRAGNWAVDPCDVRAWLDSLLWRKIPSYQGGHVNVDTKRVKGEAARYLAKYMSKGKQQIEAAMQDWGAGLCPRTWWNMNAPTRAMVRAATHKGEVVGALLEAVLEQSWLGDVNEYHAFLRQVLVDFGGVEVLMGWRGRFQPSVAADVRAMLQSSDIA